MKHSRFVVIALALVALVSFTTLAVAEGADRQAAFDSAAKTAAGVGGTHVFAAIPKGFNPLTASNRELWQYGLPDAPDKATNPRAYATWQRSMLALKTHATGLKESKYTHGPMKPAGTVPEESVSGVTYASSYNWSGIANTNKNKTWKNSTSFDEVVSVWNVPNGQPPFGASCSEGPYWILSTWNGIDGFNNGDVVQGGTNSGYECSYGFFYYGWVEWFPSYAELVIYCGSSPCPVNPGDDFEAVTYGTAGTAEQYVFVEDITNQWYGTFGLPYVTGPGVVGSSAEYINERPCCYNGYLYPLANYIFDFFDDSFAYDYAGKLFYPGSTAAATYNIEMLADNGSVISVATAGTAGFQGDYSIWFEDTGCAYSGGCAY